MSEHKTSKTTPCTVDMSLIPRALMRAARPGTKCLAAAAETDFNPALVQAPSRFLRLLVSLGDQAQDSRAEETHDHRRCHNDEDEQCHSSIPEIASRPTTADLVQRRRLSEVRRRESKADKARGAACPEGRSYARSSLPAAQSSAVPRQGTPNKASSLLRG
jgi:hypothetical protein